MTNHDLPRNDQFDKTWTHLANQGRVDGFGGSQYRRVKQEWIDAGQPENIHTFITECY